MESSFFNNFTNLFNRTEKTEDTPVLSSFRPLSEKDTKAQTFSIQLTKQPVDKDVDTVLEVSSKMNSKTTSETEILIEPEVVARTIQSENEDNHHSKLEQRSSLEKITFNIVEPHNNTAQCDGKGQEWENEVKYLQTNTQEPSGMNSYEELYRDRTFQTTSTDISNPMSIVAVSDQANEDMSTFKSHLVIPNGDFDTNTNCIHSDTGNNTIHSNREFWSSLVPDQCNECHVESKSCSETEDTLLKVKSDQVLLKLEPTTPGSFHETQEETNDDKEMSKLEMKKNDRQDKETVMKDERDNLVQIEGEKEENVMAEKKKDILQEYTNSEFLGIPSAPGNLEKPPNTENASRPTKRVTFSPDIKLEKPPPLPSFFSGLKVLKKEVNGQPNSPVLMKRASVKRALFAEKHSRNEVKGSILEQLSQLLSFDASKVGAKKTQESTTSPPVSPISEAPEAEMPPIEESVEAPDAASSEEPGKLTNSETALNAFKAFFTPKPAKRDTSDHIDLDAVKRAFNPETIRAIFDRNSSKSPDNKNIFNIKSPETEERTPGRLQAVWPPPKPKDKEEKIGLKYTEAEHQAALLQLKRECKEEIEALEANFKLQLFHLREENEESVSRLQAIIADLKKAAKCSHAELRDVAVSTEDKFTPRVFRNVCIQTDRETFIRPVEEPAINKDLCVQPRIDGETTLPLLTSPSECHSKTAQTEYFPPPTQGNSPPPPPPPPPTIIDGLSPPPPLPGQVLSPLSGSGLFLFRTEDRSQRKPRVEPICPMRPLYWTRIQIQDNRNDTLWSSLMEPAIMNSNEFAELFAKMASPAKRKPLSEAYNKSAKAKKIIKVLDSKRSQAVGILISSLHLEMKDIQQAILMMDNSVVDLDAIEALYENRAQPEELAKIRKHYETSDEEHVRLLDKPEQFLYELSLIPQFSLRAHCIILQSSFTDAVASIQRKTNMVLQVCKGLLEKDSVRDVLGLVLAFGNYMNGGSRNRGQADGFGLEILPKLKDVKSKDNRISLLDYVVSYYLRNLDKNAGTENCVFPLPEPQDVFLASQVKFEELSKELRKLGKDLEDCEKDVQRVWRTSSQEYIHPFKEKMEAFISSAQKEQIASEHHLRSAQKSYHDLLQHFGLKLRSGEQDVLPGHVFMLWFEFCNDFKTRWKRENKVISSERLKEAQQSVRNITAEKKVETRQVNANGLKERVRLKEASLSTI
ncbi:hypothetical protein HF521_012154 [Silurus meridionalis]|uniref:FH2 domain-containing protein n=1 Tax=Silurus meridionalis TaxID=175797 RepID=A0A8T0AE16_SILME|nr:hypothetical protein HF521_012154 [Silurus meridionalis]